jgi:hypothetical protein
MSLSDVKKLSGSQDSGEYNKKKLTAPPDFDGPTSNRRCTDILFAMILILCWTAMTAIGIYSLKSGDYRAVLYPMDYSGNICGLGSLEEYKKIVYINNFGGGVCVKDCPSVPDLVDPNTLITYNGIFQTQGATLSPDFVEIADYSNVTGVQSCSELTCNGWNSPGILGGNGYAYYATDTFTVLGTRCMSNPSAYEKMDELNITQGDNPVLDIDTLNEAQRIWNNLYGDIYEARYYILLFGLGASMVIGFLYTQLLRIQLILGFMIWGSIFASIGILIFCGSYAYTVANNWRNADPQVQSDSNIMAAKICSYILFGLGALAFFVTVFLRKQIQLSMACVKAAARSMSAMPTMTLFPFLQIIGFVLFMLIWLYYAIHLASTGEITTKQLPTIATASVRTYTFDDFTKQCGWYLIFCLFWTGAFINAVGEIVISMCVSKWYFSR